MKSKSIPLDEMVEITEILLPNRAQHKELIPYVKNLSPVQKATEWERARALLETFTNEGTTSGLRKYFKGHMLQTPPDYQELGTPEEVNVALAVYLTNDHHIDRHLRPAS